MNLQLLWNVGLPLRKLRVRFPHYLKCQPPPGWMRGVDFYSPESFKAAIELAARQFRESLGFWPDFLNPQRYSEKIFWQKFFGLIPVPMAGNKLMAQRFIPPSLNGEILTAQVHYRSNQPVLPANDELPAGEYMLKANHGAGMYLPVTYPLDRNARVDAEAKCRTWLAQDYGLSNGEWWYSAFEKQIMIEERLGNDPRLIDWRLHILNGKLEFISVTRVENGVIVEGLLLDSEFRPCAEQKRRDRPRLDVSLPERLGDAKSMAEEIGRNYPFLRVDFYILAGQIYLGEITFAPSGGLVNYSADFDLALGEKLTTLPDFHCMFRKRAADVQFA